VATYRGKGTGDGGSSTGSGRRGGAALPGRHLAPQPDRLPRRRLASSSRAASRRPSLGFDPEVGTRGTDLAVRLGSGTKPDIMSNPTRPKTNGTFGSDVD
jgi:hypothetical protein